MRMIRKIVAIFLIFLFPTIAFAKGLTLTVVYNNVPYDKNLTTAWGISILIEGLKKTILFDTGGDGSILLSNMEKLKIEPKNIDIVVLSHIHGDHVGGLWNFLRKNNRVSLYLPKSFPKSFNDRARKICKEVISVKRSIKICDRVWSTGELGTWMKEQSLIIHTPKGLIIVTGCAHPGVVNIVKVAKDMFKKELYLVTGGFHLLAYSENRVKKIIKQLKRLGVKKVAPSHCTGGRPIELFREAWRKNFIELGCGARIKID